MPDFDDPDQKAKDHGNLIDEGVAEVEREAAEGTGAQDDHGLAPLVAKSLPPTDRPTGADAFSETHGAALDLAPEESRRERSVPTGAENANNGGDERASELRAEQLAEAQDSVT